MTPSARLQATLELLEMIETVLRPADALVSGYFRARRYIGSKDKNAVSSMTYALMRHHARLNWWLDKLKYEKTPRHRLMAYMYLINKENISTFDELFSGKKFAPSPLSEDERKFLSKLKGHTIQHNDMPEEVAGECPLWALQSLKKRFGKHFAASMGALLEPAPLDLRVNSLREKRDSVLIQLTKQGLPAKACRYSPWGIRIKSRLALDKLPMLRDGTLEIQDEGSQLVALLMDAKPGERVVDFCAGAGGKTLAIAAQMQNKGHIVACDVLEKRLKRSAERFRRAGLHNIMVKSLTNERDPWVKKHKESFDRVLVDAPCSGTGTWRRNPDQRWRSLGPGLEALLPLQASILESASRLVKPGGRLVYATCSLLEEENELQIEAFLAKHEIFKVLNLKKAFPEKPEIEKLNELLDGEPYLALSPLRHKTDGFFAAVLERKGQFG